MVVLRDGRLVTGDEAGSVLMWHVDRPDDAAVRLGGCARAVRVLAALADGRVVSGDDEDLLIWDPVTPEVVGPTGSAG